MKLESGKIDDEPCLATVSSDEYVYAKLFVLNVFPSLLLWGSIMAVGGIGSNSIFLISAMCLTPVFAVYAAMVTAYHCGMRKGGIVRYTGWLMLWLLVQVFLTVIAFLVAALSTAESISL